jgi:integrase/recombinase XerD
MLGDDTPDPWADYDADDNSGRHAPLDSGNDHAESLAVEWLEWMRTVRHRSANTLVSYNRELQAYLAWCEKNDVDPLRPSQAQLEAFMTRRLKNGRVRSRSSQNTSAATVRGYFSYMAERELVPTNCAKDLFAPEVKRSDGRPVDDEHWKIIWAADMSQQIRAALGLAYYGGLRVSELTELRCDAITPTRLVSFERKGGEKDTLPWLDMAETVARKLPHLLPDVGVLTSAVLHVKNNYEGVVPWKRRGSMYKMMTRLTARLDIPMYTPHQLRHSTATNLLDAGVPPHIVMRLMNHKSFNTTMKYVRAGAGELRRWLDLNE